MHTILIWTAGVQGVYFVASGIWPLVHMPSFLKVTGPKQDRWLVQTVGVLVGIIGCVLLVAAVRGTMELEIVLLGAGAALGLAMVDCIFVLRRIIGPIYLLDAIAELLLLIAWLAGALAR